MQDLGTLEDFSLSVALAINDKNQVVGVSAKTWGDHRGMIDPRDWWFDKAFLWENGTLLDLNTLIPAHSGWELGTAFSINNAGQIIGYGIYKQRKHAFLLNPVP